MDLLVEDGAEGQPEAEAERISRLKGKDTQMGQEARTRLRRGSPYACGCNQYRWMLYANPVRASHTHTPLARLPNYLALYI